ncbi:hypothetical protein [Shewanella sp.]|uniref:hypothetical protein n=1 Tax=Shewanella sp. TaxID=50422 RepID=UPI004048A5DC
MPLAVDRLQWVPKGVFDEIKLENKFSNVLMIIKPKVMWYWTLYRLTQTHNKKAQA